MIFSRCTQTFLTVVDARRVSMWLVCVVAVCMLRCVPTDGQTLDFSGAPETPQLNQFSFTWELHQILESEIAQRMGALRAATPVQNLVLRASVNYRRIAADLLDAAHREQQSGAIAFLYGLTLADGRSSLDRSLQTLVDLDHTLAAAPDEQPAELLERFARVSRMVRLFNEQVTHKAPLLHTADVGDLDEHLSVVFSPLEQAIAELQQQHAVSYWPVAGHIRIPNTPGAATLSVASTDTPPPTVETLYQQSQTLKLPPDAMNAITTILEFLQRGRVFAELQPMVMRYADVMDRVFIITRTLEKATWLRDDTRDSATARLLEAIRQFAQPDQREAAIGVIDELSRCMDVVSRIDTLIEAQAHRRNIIKPVVETFTAIMLDSASTVDSRMRRMRNLAAVLDRMIAYRLTKAHKLRQELRAVQVRLQRLYEQAEVELVEQLPRLVSDADALADPAMSSHISQQRQYLADLQRVAEIPAWIDTMATLVPQAAEPFLRQSRKMAAWLLDTTRRPDATRAMQQFEQQLAMFHPLPFEQQLRAGDATAAILTGGMHEQLLDMIDRTRAQWAWGWADGDAGSDAANEMLMLYRLMYTLASTREVQLLDGDLSLLNRWGGWQLNHQAIARAFSDLPSRLQLAIAAVVRDDADDLRRQLERIDRDAPLAKLTGRLAMILEEDMRARPGDPSATLGQMMYPPGDDAWLGERRMQLATLCWNALEQEYARATDQREHLGMLSKCVAFHVDELLTVLGERRDALPTLSGFDGSDPNPDVPEIRIRD